jgi:hypothetical protein
VNISDHYHLFSTLALFLLALYINACCFNMALSTKGNFDLLTSTTLCWEKTVKMWYNKSVFHGKSITLILLRDKCLLSHISTKSWNPY